MPRFIGGIARKMSWAYLAIETLYCENFRVAFFPFPLIFCLSIWENIRYEGITRNRHQFNETIQHIVTYQVSKGQMINVVALISDPSMMGTTHEGHWSCGATTGELVDQFNGWETPVVDLLQVGSQ